MFCSFIWKTKLQWNIKRKAWRRTKLTLTRASSKTETNNKKKKHSPTIAVIFYSVKTAENPGLSAKMYRQRSLNWKSWAAGGAGLQSHPAAAANLQVL